MNRQWLDNLKIAIVNKDIKSIDDLCSNTPYFSNIDETIEAKALVEEALNIVLGLKNQDKIEFEKLKKVSKFLSQTI